MKRLLLTSCVALACAAHAVTAAPPVASTEGKLKDGTPYRIDMPQHWNGAVLIGLDYASRPPGADAQALFAEGYALAGTTRAVSGWAIHRAAANAVETLDLVEAKYGKAALPIEFGQSQGGHTAAVSAQAYPARWRGAVVQCGGLSGAIGQWQGKLDGLFVAKALLAPDSSLPVTGIPDDWQTTVLPAWTAMFEEAEKTPAGRARIALAARIAQLPEWSIPSKPEPAAGDAQARANGLADGLVRGLYRDAGLSLDADLATLAKAPRLSADPKAVAYFATGTFDGDLKIPVLTMTGIGDAISPSAAQQDYQAAVERAGKGELLRQTYTHSAGHCGFTPAETVAGVHALVTRVKSGQWPDTSAAGMTALARATGLGESRFIRYTPRPFLRSYPACKLLGDLKAAGVQPFVPADQAPPRCIQP